MPKDDDEVTKLDPKPWGGQQRLLPRRGFKAACSVIILPGLPPERPKLTRDLDASPISAQPQHPAPRSSRAGTSPPPIPGATRPPLPAAARTARGSTPPPVPAQPVVAPTTAARDEPTQPTEPIPRVPTPRQSRFAAAVRRLLQR